MSKKKITVAITILLAIAAFTGGALLYSRALTPETDSVKAGLIRPHSPVIGPDSAPVTITEFFDPSCEACRAFYPYVKAILERYPTQVRLVMRYAAFHQGSAEAIGILEAARAQGKFEEVLFTIFRDQPVWASHNKPDLESAWKSAAETGLDIEKAKRDATSQETQDVIAQDMEDIGVLGVRMTPTFYINGQQMNVSGPEDLARKVDGAVAQAIAPRRAAH